MMIDLHCHMLAGVDDGAPDLDMALRMARAAVADGIGIVACTPHFMPGVHDNEARDIRARVSAFNGALQKAGIALSAVTGADAHVRPDFVACLNDGRILTLHDSRYVLVEPPHHNRPPKFDDFLFKVAAAGFVPILTHPERFGWVEHHYQAIRRLVHGGVWMQITAGSLTGRFGKRTQYWAERMLGDGIVHILATDAHNLTSRPPLLAEACAAAERIAGPAEARHLVLTRPMHVLNNAPPEVAPPVPAHVANMNRPQSFWSRIKESIWA